MRKTAAIIAAAALAITAHALTVEEARANLNAARAAYRAALAEAGVTSTPRLAVSTAATPVLTKSQAAYFKNRRICVGRDTTTIPGSVITTWYRNGRPDTLAPAVVTNVLHSISGAMQDNPLQTRIEELRAQYQEAIERATSAEARAARLDALRAWLVEQRDKAVLPTTKAIYQAIIDRIDEKLEGL